MYQKMENIKDLKHISIFSWHQVVLNKSWILCLVLLQVPKCFGLVQIFCARPKIYLHIVAVTNILCQTKRWFAFSKIGFCAGTKVFEEALNAVKFLGWLKQFGPAQNILGLVKGQGIWLETIYLKWRYKWYFIKISESWLDDSKDSRQEQLPVV